MRFSISRPVVRCHRLAPKMANPSAHFRPQSGNAVGNSQRSLLTEDGRYDWRLTILPFMVVSVSSPLNQQCLCSKAGQHRLFVRDWLASIRRSSECKAEHRLTCHQVEGEVFVGREDRIGPEPTRRIRRPGVLSRRANSGRWPWPTRLRGRPWKRGLPTAACILTRWDVAHFGVLITNLILLRSRVRCVYPGVESIARRGGSPSSSFRAVRWSPAREIVDLPFPMDSAVPDVEPTRPFPRSLSGRGSS